MSDYRSPTAVLEERRGDLEREIRALREKQAEAVSLAERLPNVEKELERVENELAQLRRVPALDHLVIASPCEAQWTNMVGNERVRFCGACKKNVYNIEAMSRAEAEALLLANETVCLRVARRVDGTVLTNDCPVGQKQKRRRLCVISASVAGALAASGFVIDAQRMLIDAHHFPRDETESRAHQRRSADPGTEHVRHTLGGGTLGLAENPAEPSTEPRVNEPESRPARTTEKRRAETPKGCNCFPGDPLCACLYRM